MSNSQWISVKDALPQKSGDYIVYQRYLGVTVLPYAVTYQRWNAHDNTEYGAKYALDVGSVTHWMPLPDAPEGVE